MDPLCAVQKAYTDSLWMFEDCLVKIPDDLWRTGADGYLVPVRIAYHIFMSVEWLTTHLPPDEHKQTRRYRLNWLEAVEAMPDRQSMLGDLPWARAMVAAWFSEQPVDEIDREKRLEKSLYFLRHIQHHLGELGIACRLLKCPSPDWK